MYRSILVPLDGSRAGEHALPLAFSIAHRASATLRLAHVHDPARPMFWDAMPLFDEWHDAEHRERERAYLDDLACRLIQRARLSITTALLNGPVASALALYALAGGVDLIVMTPCGRSAQMHAWLGSVTNELARRAVSPVLLARPQDTVADLAHEQVCRRVLVPLDGSAQSARILAHVVALGAVMRAEYTLLHVVEEGLGRRSRAWAYLDRVAARLRAEALRVRADVVVGEPAAAILDYAREHAVDLIAMETHERRGVKQLPWGSVTEQVLRGAPVPLLLHHPRQEAGRVEAWRGREALSCSSG